MKQIILGILIGAIAVFGYHRFLKKTETITGSQLIEQKLKNVSKLVVTEGYFSDVITYKDAKKYYLDWLTAEKKAVVLVNAKATISYDLKQLEFSVNESEQIIRIVKIPEPEIQLSPKLKYYDIQQDFLNPFEVKDYNKISALVDQRLLTQIERSTFKTNAQNRLITELHYLFNKGTTKNWSLEYDDISESLFELKN
ncbi:DUF4230 domain-containing protein [Aquimarina agarilytica]|uniref:DUF4230 domain-containing protein n=1 Tax=Aquimarina agarilytica TaxID=1087449 RepID=UPI00028894A3|nr:DUF4230 domain-containing protein [Aquimarina agarilytica]